MSLLRNVWGALRWLLVATMIAGTPACAEDEAPKKKQFLFEMPELSVIVRHDRNSTVYEVFNHLIKVQVIYVLNNNAPFAVQDYRSKLMTAMEAAVASLTYVEVREANGAVLLKEKLLAAARDVLGENAVDEVLLQRLIYR